MIQSAVGSWQYAVCVACQYNLTAIVVFRLLIANCQLRTADRQLNYWPYIRMLYSNTLFNFMQIPSLF
jgi:hypothetical protein